MLEKDNQPEGQYDQEPGVIEQDVQRLGDGRPGRGIAFFASLRDKYHHAAHPAAWRDHAEKICRRGQVDQAGQVFFDTEGQEDIPVRCPHVDHPDGFNAERQGQESPITLLQGCGDVLHLGKPADDKKDGQEDGKSEDEFAHSVQAD